MNIAFLGTGLMGAGFVRRMLTQGHAAAAAASRIVPQLGTGSPPKGPDRNHRVQMTAHDRVGEHRDRGDMGSENILNREGDVL